MARVKQVTRQPTRGLARPPPAPRSLPATSGRQVMAVNVRDPLVNPPGGKCPRSSLSAHATSSGAARGAHRAHRWRPGTVALREIKKFQGTTQNLIPRAPFARLCNEIARTRLSGAIVGKRTVDVLQEAAEMHITQRMEDVQMAAFHARRITITPADFKHIELLYKRRFGVSDRVDG